MKTAEEKKVVKALTIISVRAALSIVGRAVSDIGSDASVREVHRDLDLVEAGEDGRLEVPE